MNERPKPPTIKLVSVSGFGVENTANTQCSFVLVGLDENGCVWTKRDVDLEWYPESMKQRDFYS